jgi:hypothetical protein
MDESFALACRLTGAKIVRRMKQGRAGARERGKSAGKLHNGKKWHPRQEFLDLHGGQSAGRAAVALKLTGGGESHDKVE